MTLFRYKLLLCGLFCAALIPTALAQGSASDFVLMNPRFQNYTMQQGLSSNFCYDVFQDKKGFMWVATFHGLNRFDGNQWLSFQQQSKERKHRIQANWVVDINDNDPKQIWINTLKGVAAYSYRNKEIVRFKNPVKGWGKITSPRPDQVYVSSWTGIDCYQVKGSQLLLQKHFRESEDNTFNFLYTDSNAVVWACPEDRPSLIRIDSKTKQLRYFSTLDVNGKALKVVIRSVAAYSKDTLLLSTQNWGLLKFCTRSFKAFAVLPDFKHELSCALRYRLHNEDFLVLGTVHHGLYIVKLNNGSLHHYAFSLNNPNGILSNSITALSSDDNQGLWVATNRGLSFFHPSLQKSKLYSFYNNPVIPPSVLINHVEALSADDFLIATDNCGLFHFNEQNQVIKRIPVAPVEDDFRIHSVMKLNPGEFLLATNQGLYRYDAVAQSCRFFPLDPELDHLSLMRIREVAPGLLAFCSSGGVVLLDWNSKKIRYSELKLKPKAFCKDAFLKGADLWILRFFDGYECVNLQTGVRKDFTPASFRGEPINYSGFAAADTALFVATSSGIIVQHLIHKNKQVVLNSEHGLDGDVIENVLLSSSNALFYTSPVGLFRYDFRKGISLPVCSYQNYAQKWFNQLSQAADGSLIFSISDYFMVFQPRIGFHNQKTPALALQSFSVNGVEQPIYAEKLSFSSDENNLLLQFAALVYPEADKNKWFYRLSGAGKLSGYAQNGSIRLMNLAPGSYQLRVFSINNEGLKSVDSSLISFTIHLPFYQSWWFIVGLLLLTLAIFALFYRSRHKQQLRLLQMRNQISRDLHDELGAHVSSINIMSKMLKSRSQLDDPVLNNISKYAVQISDTVNDIIWNINPKFDSLDALMQKMMRFASETLEATSIRYSFDLPDMNPEKQLGIQVKNEVKYHVFLIFKEALNNAVKYSGSEELNIKISYDSRHFLFEICDFGVGFDPQNELGNGLSNMRLRAAEIGAELDIHSVLQKGSRITLKVKLS